MKYYANHDTHQGRWCVWSYTDAPADAQPEDQCPAGCEASGVVEEVVVSEPSPAQERAWNEMRQAE